MNDETKATKSNLYKTFLSSRLNTYNGVLYLKIGVSI